MTASTPGQAVWRRGGRAGRWLGNLLLMLAAFAVSGTCGEFAVRWIHGDRMVLYPRYHSRAVYGDYTLRRLRPRTVFWHRSIDGHWRFATNSAGFRSDRDVPYARTPGRLRVLALGDSQTEGFEVRQDRTYTSVIERWLNANGIAAEVVNAGISGFGAAESLAFLENEGYRYRPDVVVYGMFANDFLDNVRSGLFVIEGDTLAVRSRVYAPAVRILDVLNAIPPMRWLSEHSYLYSLAFNTAWDWFKAASARRADRRLATEYVTADPAPTEDQVSLMRALVSRMSRFCRERGILFVVLDLPVPAEIGRGGYASSVPPSLLGDLGRAADVLLLSGEVLGPPRPTAPVHVEHGQHHVSEYTHLRFGMRAAQAIRDRAAALDRTAHARTDR